MTKEQLHNPASKRKIGNEQSIDDNGKEILLNEAIRKREEILHHMEENTSKVFTLSNTSLVLIGAYITGMALLGKKWAGSHFSIYICNFSFNRGFYG